MSPRRPDLRPRPRRPSLSPRAALVAALAVALALPGAAYVGWRWLSASDAFAVRSVVVHGTGAPLAAEVRHAALRAVHGRSLLALSSGEVAAELEAIPAVRTATVDRSFPSTLRVRVVAERPFAVARAGADRLVLSETGRVLEVVASGGRAPALPILWLKRRPAVAAGARLRTPGVLDRLAALRAVPVRFGGRVARAELDAGGGVSLRLRSNLEIRLGPPLDLDRKLRVARVLLHRYPLATERAALRYMDVSAGSHPVVCPTGGDPATRSIPADSPNAPLIPSDQLSGTALAAACLVPGSNATTTATTTSTGTATATTSTTGATATSSSGTATTSTATSSTDAGAAAGGASTPTTTVAP